MSWGTITPEKIAEAATLIDVPLRRDRMQWIEAATRDAIRHFAWGIGDNNPLWQDRDYAAQSPWGRIIAPPCLLYAVDNTVVAPKLPGVQWIYAGTAWTWHEPIFIDDSFRVEARLVKQEEKSGRRFPTWVLQTGEVRFFNQHDRLVATALGRCARTPRGDKLVEAKGKEHVAAKEPHSYTAKEIERIESEVLAEPRTGDRPLYWEDVEVGIAIPQVVRGPLSIVDIMAWYSAQQGAQPYGGVHGDALRYRQRHADYHVNKTTGARESAGRGHLEAKTGGDVGMGGAYDIGPQRISWAQHMLSNWMGDHGFLHKLDIAVRRPNLVGDTIWWRGCVTGKTVNGDHAVLELSLIATNQEGAESANGTATVILPSRDKGPVRWPVHLTA
ncbi:MAG: FAS1-like dehydratase domain-containing protein [Sphingobium phenoxybenzoativorans]